MTKDMNLKEVFKVMAEERQLTSQDFVPINKFRDFLIRARDIYTKAGEYDIQDTMLIAKALKLRVPPYIVAYEGNNLPGWVIAEAKVIVAQRNGKMHLVKARSLNLVDLESFKS